jgi:hypothetical protein
LLVHDCTTAFLLDHLHRAVKLSAAVTLGRPKNVARQTLRMDSDQRRDVTTHLAFKEDYKLFVGSQGAVSGDLKVAPLGGQIGDRHPLDSAGFHVIAARFR